MTAIELEKYVLQVECTNCKSGMKMLRDSNSGENTYDHLLDNIEQDLVICNCENARMQITIDATGIRVNTSRSGRVEGYIKGG